MIHTIIKHYCIRVKLFTLILWEKHHANSIQNRYITQKVTQKVTQLFKNHCNVNASSQSGHVNDRYLNWICLKCYSNHSIGSLTPVITIKRFCTDFGVLTPRTKQRGVTPSYQPFRRGVFISYQNFRKMLLCMSFFPQVIVIKVWFDNIHTVLQIYDNQILIFSLYW